MPNDSIEEERGEVVTSCLGRRSAASSRMTSAMTGTSEGGINDVEVETIQWKRGNLLGKGKEWDGDNSVGWIRSASLSFLFQVPMVRYGVDLPMPAS